MEDERERADEAADDGSAAEYPAGSETPADPPGVGEGELDEDQPGLLEDPPQTE